MIKNLCPHCGCDLDIEREVFANDKLYTGHNCQGYDNSEKQKIIRVLSVLRQNGVPCFLASQLLEPAIAEMIKGEG